MPDENSDPETPPLPMLPRVVKVHADPVSDTIVAIFGTGERRRYDVRPLLDKGVFQRIREPEAFSAVHVDEMGGIVWEAGPDLSRDTVFLGGEPA